MIEKPESLLSS